jgi:hypothetical protein
MTDAKDWERQPSYSPKVCDFRKQSYLKIVTTIFSQKDLIFILGGLGLDP